MKRFSIFCLLALMISVPRTTYAAVFEHDWQDPNDGLLTYDDVNQREWLDLSETLLVDWGLDPNNVVAQLGPGGYFQGFEFAKSADVIALAESAGIDTVTLDFSVNSVPTDQLISLLGVTALSGGNTRSSFGVVDELASVSMTLSDDLVAAIETIPPYQEAGLRFVPYGGLTDTPYLITGVMLYRQIPEPSTSTLIIPVALATLSLRWEG